MTNTKRTKSRQRKVKRRLPSLTPARVRLLALEHKTIAEADAHLGRRWDLPELLAERAELDAAWARGRFLRYLRRLAGSGASLGEAAHALHLTPDELTERINTDAEVAGTWNEARLETAIEVKAQWLAKAKEGNARAMSQIEMTLRNEIAHAALDIHDVPTEKMLEIASISPTTLNRWWRNEGMPRNAGATTYDLPSVWIWHEKFVQRRGGRSPADNMTPLQAAKVRREELQTAQLESRLWERDKVLASLAVRAEALARALSATKAAELSQRFAGKTAPEVARGLEGFFEDARREACRFPDELLLEPEAQAMFERLMGVINQKKGNGGGSAAV
jgi:hypothetical protein